MRSYISFPNMLTKPFLWAQHVNEFTDQLINRWPVARAKVVLEELLRHSGITSVPLPGARETRKMGTVLFTNNRVDCFPSSINLPNFSRETHSHTNSGEGDHTSRLNWEVTLSGFQVAVTQCKNPEQSTCDAKWQGASEAQMFSGLYLIPLPPPSKFVLIKDWFSLSACLWHMLDLGKK